MVLEPKSTSLKIMSSSSNRNKEPTLGIQAFHQCSSLISIKLSTPNLFVWRSQVTSLICSLGLYHHLISCEKLDEKIKDDEGKKSPNLLQYPWINYDGLLSPWLLRTIKEEVMSLIYCEANTAQKIWTSIEEQLFPITVEKEGLLKNILISIRKGTKFLDEYLKEFKSVYDNFDAIKKPDSDHNKIFYFTHGLGIKYMDF